MEDLKTSKILLYVKEVQGTHNEQQGYLWWSVIASLVSQEESDYAKTTVAMETVLKGNLLFRTTAYDRRMGSWHEMRCLS